MTLTNPDKHIRKAFFNLLNGINVNSNPIYFYDMLVSQNTRNNNYIVINSQTKEQVRSNKCEYYWNSSFTLDIYTKNKIAGNNGSRLLLNDIEQEVLNKLNTAFTVPNFTLIDKDWSCEAQLETITDSEIITRSIIRVNLTLK